MPNDSAIMRFVQRLYAMQARLEQAKSSSVVVGWVDKVHEQERAMPKEQALAINAANKKKGRKSREVVSNFDANFIGPGRAAASLAKIAKTMNYGRAPGKTKDGHEYGRIPARNFVEVLKRKHLKPLERLLVESVIDTSNPNPSLNLETFGVVAKGQLQRAMKDSNEYAPLSEFTKHGGWMANPVNGKPFYAAPRKGERPLWNRGVLINSVDFEIRNGNNGNGGHGL